MEDYCAEIPIVITIQGHHIENTVRRIVERILNTGIITISIGIG
jgi:hypothetical protein